MIYYRTINLTFNLLIFVLIGCSDKSSFTENKNSDDVTEKKDSLALTDLQRSIQIMDDAMSSYFNENEDDFKMARYYNPWEKTRSSEIASVWMYGSSMEAAIAILKSLKLLKEKKVEGAGELYRSHYEKYIRLLKKLYVNADYYLGTYKLTSFTQTKEWTVYAVDRANEKNGADVSGILNVYDDQMWLIREFIQAFELTNDKEYLERAEYLTAYVLDGWDTHRDENGIEIGGIPWGPGYVTKHSASNGPLISSLVWLHELYQGKDDEVEYRYIDKKDKETRRIEKMKKSDFYLFYAKKVYKWQKENLKTDEGVYDDMLGGCEPHCDPEYEVVNGVKYRKNAPLHEVAGPPISYNSGTMLSGGADLYKATKKNTYLTDIKELSDDSFEYFAELGAEVPNNYTYASDGFNNWFNGVLLRGYKDVFLFYPKTGKYIETFQKNLDFAYRNHLYNGFLPSNLLEGWEKGESEVEGQSMFAFAAQYAILSQYVLLNNNN